MHCRATWSEFKTTVITAKYLIIREQFCNATTWRMDGGRSRSAKAPAKLSEEKIKDLIEVSRDAKTRAYVPYSHFRVGAALLTTEGEVYTGATDLVVIIIPILSMY